MKSFFSFFLALWLSFNVLGQDQIQFKRDLVSIDSLISVDQYFEAKSRLLSLKESLVNTSLLDDDSVKLFFSSKLVFVASNLGDCGELLNLSQEDLGLKSEIYGEGDPISLTAARNHGVHLLNCDSLEKSEETLENVVAVHNKAFGTPDQLLARTMDDLAFVKGRLGQFEEAAAIYESLISLLGTSKNEFYLNVLSNYSALLMSNEQYQKAADYYEDLSEYFQDEVDYPGFQRDYYNLFVNLKDYVSALKASESLIRWCEGNSSVCEEEEIDTQSFYLNAARLSFLLSQYEKANKYYKKSENAFFGSSAYITILLEEADLFRETREPYKALNALSKSLAYHQSNQWVDSTSYHTTVLNLGRIYTETGQFDRADELFSGYITDLANSSGKRERLAEAYQSLGNQRYLVQDYKGADEYFSRSRQIFEEEGLNKGQGYASLLNSSGALNEALSNYAGAERDYREALRIVYEKESAIRIALASNLANVIMLNDLKNDSTLVLLNQAVSWQQESSGEVHPAYANLLSNRGVFFQKNDRNEEALSDFARAIEVFEYTVGENHPQYLAALINMGLSYENAGNFELAETTIIKARDLYIKHYSKLHPGYIRAVNNLANNYTKQQAFAKAEPFFLELAAAQVNEINNSFTYLSEEEKKRFVKEKQKLLNNFKGYVVARSIQEEGAVAGEIVREWYNLELSTKGMLLNSTKKVRDQIFNSEDEELIGLFSEWTVIRKQIADLQSLKSKKEDNSQVLLDSLNNQINEIEKQLSRKSSEFETSFKEEKPSFVTIKSKLQVGEASVEIVRTELNDEGVYSALIGTREDEYPFLMVLGKGEEFERRGFSVYKNAIKFKVEDGKSYSTYWKPIHDFLISKNITKVYYAPDGVYHKISLNTLFNPVSKEYLIDELDIIQLSATKDILNMRDDVSEQFQIDGVLLVGRPAYDLEGAATIQGDTRSFSMISNVSDLPGTEEEVKEIEGLMESKSLEYEVLLKENADESSVKARLNKDLVHIATHGFFMEKEGFENSDPMLSSGLLLAGVSNEKDNPSEEDGVLTAFEIMNLNLSNLKMIVLSACETGLGEIASGEGIYGLQRAFFVAGTESVVMSLWKVDDEATRDLMIAFYKSYLKGGNKREAFLEAQRKVKKKYKNPIYWGAFVMLGS